jgi:hypothetical protein
MVRGRTVQRRGRLRRQRDAARAGAASAWSLDGAYSCIERLRTSTAWRRSGRSGCGMSAAGPRASAAWDPRIRGHGATVSSWTTCDLTWSPPPLSLRSSRREGQAGLPQARGWIPQARCARPDRQVQHEVPPGPGLHPGGAQGATATCMVAAWQCSCMQAGAMGQLDECMSKRALWDVHGWKARG